MVEPNVNVDEGVPITVEFRCDIRYRSARWLRTLMACSGGLDMLFSNQRKHSVSLPAIDENGKPSNMASLVRHLCKYVMKDPRKEFFVVDDAMFVISP